MGQPVTKLYPSLGCCGLDCSLCPRYQMEGQSRCPGCLGHGFGEKHPGGGCAFTRCCARDKELEVCAFCEEYPCARFDNEGRIDSFVTHRKVLENQAFIRDRGLAAFLTQQARRTAILEELLARHNEGRSKTVYCLGCTLLPLEDLEQIMVEAGTRLNDTPDIKERASAVKSLLEKAARGVVLKLVKKA